MSRPGTKAAHRQFCVREGWEEAKTARGKSVGHRTTYKMTLPDGTRLRTRVSRPADNTNYGPELWQEILRQLDVAEDEFWDCVDSGKLPNRDAEPKPTAGSLPLRLVRQLESIGIPPNEAIGLTVTQATGRIAAYWRQQARE